MLDVDGWKYQFNVKNTYTDSFCRFIYFIKLCTRYVRVILYLEVKIKIPSSCEIEYFVETHLCKLCVILRLREQLGVCPR